MRLFYTTLLLFLASIVPMKLVAADQWSVLPLISTGMVTAFLDTSRSDSSIIAIGPFGVSEFEISEYESEILYFAALTGHTDFINLFLIIKSLQPDVEFTPENFNLTSLFLPPEAPVANSQQARGTTSNAQTPISTNATVAPILSQPSNVLVANPVISGSVSNSFFAVIPPVLTNGIVATNVIATNTISTTNRVMVTSGVLATNITVVTNGIPTSESAVTNTAAIAISGTNSLPAAETIFDSVSEDLLPLPVLP